MSLPRLLALFYSNCVLLWGYHEPPQHHQAASRAMAKIAMYIWFCFRRAASARLARACACFFSLNSIIFVLIHSLAQGYTTVIVQLPVKSKSFTRLRSLSQGVIARVLSLLLVPDGCRETRTRHRCCVLLSKDGIHSNKDERLELVELRRQRSLALRPDWVDPSGSSPVSHSSGGHLHADAFLTCSNRSVTFLR